MSQTGPSRFALWVFLIAGVYGVLALLPLYFLEGRFGRDYPPAVAHPEFFYGFVGVALAWQVAFLVIAHDPVRHRPLMIPAVLEKFSFAVAAGVLFAQGRLPDTMLAGGVVDALLGVLFLVAFWRTASGQSRSG
jgi:hypothetical protein